MFSVLSLQKKPVLPFSIPSAAQEPSIKRAGVAHDAASLTTSPFVSNVEGKSNRSAAA
jgi:hypothetical protein